MAVAARARPESFNVDFLGASPSTWLSQAKSKEKASALGEEAAKERVGGGTFLI